MALYLQVQQNIEDNKEANAEGNDGIIIVKRTLDGLRTVLDWIRLDEWNPGRRDADGFFAADGKVS